MATQFDSTPLPNGFDEQRARVQIAEARSYHEDLERERPQLLADHEGQWVTSYKGRFLFGDSVKEVLAAAEQAKWPLDVIAISHLTRSRAKVLL